MIRTVLMILILALPLPLAAQEPVLEPVPEPAQEQVQEQVLEAEVLPGDAGAFQVRTISRGIHLFRPEQATGRHTNSLVIERRDGLLVVDAQPTTEAAQDLLAAIRGVSATPVRYLVFTHPHVEASGGSDAFPPEVLRIASRGYRDAVADTAFGYQSEWRAYRGIPEPAEGGPDPQRRPVATLTLMGRTRLEDPLHPIVLLPIPHTHSPGDLLVYEPRAEIVAVGDLVFNNRNPYAGHARVSSWISQLNQLLTLSPKTIVPLRGGAVDVTRVRNQRDALRWLKKQVEEKMAGRIEEERISQTILRLPDAERYFNTAVAPSNLPLLVRRLVDEVRKERREQGLE
jgi:glyoxylase-like metal-dependent hydrolase (beta-lactamase superfamily II)